MRFTGVKTVMKSKRNKLIIKTTERPSFKMVFLFIIFHTKHNPLLFADLLMHKDICTVH